MNNRKPTSERSPASVSAAASGSQSLQAGDLVRIRPRPDIEKTLDQDGQLRGCLYMSEMWQYCGTVHRVLKPMHQYLDEQDYKIRECRGIVLLENVMCCGSAYPEGCDCSCFFFWREEWLEKIPDLQSVQSV